MAHMLLMSFDHSRPMNLYRTLNRFIEYAFVLLQKPKINFCFIGTASEDRLIESIFFSGFIRAKFGKCVNANSLILTKINLTPQQMENFLSSQDILFIGGGNTERMLQIWEKSGFAATLKKLRNEFRLPILSGVSAGAMYPFHSGLTDSTPGQYKPLDCFQWFKDSFCPHANSKVRALCAFERNKYLKRMDAYSMAIKTGVLPSGYAVPNDCMLHFFNEKLVNAYGSRANSQCYYVTNDKTIRIDTKKLTSKNIDKMVHESLASQGYIKKTSANDRIFYNRECWKFLFLIINTYYKLLSLL